MFALPGPLIAERRIAVVTVRNTRRGFDVVTQVTANGTAVNRWLSRIVGTMTPFDICEVPNVPDTRI